MLLPTRNRLLYGHSSWLAGDVARLSGVIGAGTPEAGPGRLESSQTAAAEASAAGAAPAMALKRLRTTKVVWKR